jgi:hypothetical protein
MNHSILQGMLSNVIPEKNIWRRLFKIPVGESGAILNKIVKTLLELKYLLILENKLFNLSTIL